MKKYLSIILAAIMAVLSCGITALAEEGGSGITVPELSSEEVISAWLDYEPLKQTYSLYGGFGKEKRGNITVGVKVSDKNGAIADAAVTTAERDANGRVIFTFDPIVFSDDSASGTYTFELSSFLGKKTLTAEFLNSSDALEVLLKLDTQTGTDYENTLLNSGSGMGADISVYKNLSPAGKTAVLAKLYKVKSGLTADTKTDPDRVAKVNKAVDSFLSAYNEATAVEEFNDCETAAEVSAWIAKYADKFSLKVGNDYAWEYYAEEDGKVKAAADAALAKVSGMADMNAIKAKLAEVLLCAKLDRSHVSFVDTLLSRHSAAFGLDLTGYNALSDKSSVKSGIVNKAKFTYAEVKEMFDALVTARQLAEAGGGSGNGGSSGGSGGGSKPVSGIGGGAAGTPSVGSSNPFTDLPNNHWAKDYILYLNQKQIMQGKGDGVFEPDTFITRAEAVKLIAAALGLTGTADITLADVSDGDWFVEYVAAALANGVIVGDENGCFRPNDRITRQDLAVMLYRAMKVSASIDELSFTDADQISVYAVGAVGYFARRGIISGYPEGHFAPFGNATRAEAAKIISSILN